MAGGTLLNPAEKVAWQDWNKIPRPMRGEQTNWVYIGPDGSFWNLSGRQEGRQGVKMTKELGGAYHLPFEQLLTESAYQVGATYERTNIKKRLINLGVVLGGPPHSNLAYSMIESNWWDAWPPDQPGWLGCQTRCGGWRWASVQLAKPTETRMAKDPRYAGNNVMTWDMDILAVNPWYAKRALFTTWTAHAATVAAHGFDEETISIANRSNLTVWPKFIFSPGQVSVQDGMTENLLKMPLSTIDADGNVLVDTDPTQRTLTADKDPVDNLFYDLIRSSRLLDFFLHDLGSLGVPIWRRLNGVRFTSPIPPRTIANLKVRHNTAGGTVTVVMPQRFSRPS